MRRPRKPSPPRNRQPNMDEKLDAFLAKGCGCKLDRGKECYLLFSEDYLYTKRVECSALSREGLDMVILGQIMAFTQSDDVVGPSHKHAPTNRKASRVMFHHAGKKICALTFLALHGIGKTNRYFMLSCLN